MADVLSGVCFVVLGVWVGFLSSSGFFYVSMKIIARKKGFA